jgi:hypothetical protein
MPGRRHNPNRSPESTAVPWDQLQTCPTSGKRPYATESEAEAAATQRLSEPRPPAHLSVYKCLYCGSWHLTSKDSR